MRLHTLASFSMNTRRKKEKLQKILLLFLRHLTTSSVKHYTQKRENKFFKPIKLRRQDRSIKMKEWSDLLSHIEEKKGFNVPSSDCNQMVVCNRKHFSLRQKKLLNNGRMDIRWSRTLDIFINEFYQWNETKSKIDLYQCCLHLFNDNLYNDLIFNIDIQRN